MPCEESLWIADTAPPDQFQKFLACLRLTAERSQHRAGDGDGVLFFHTPHHHAEMSGFDDDADAMGIQLRAQRFRDLHGQPFLHLQTSGEHIDDPWDLAETDHLLVGQIADMDPAKKRQEMMFAHTEKIDVFDDDHFVIVDRKERPVQEMVDITLVPLRHKGQGFGHSLRGLEQPIPTGFLTESEKHLRDQRLEDR
jgi:hypothetical protein